MHSFFAPKPPTARERAKADIAMQVAAQAAYDLLTSAGQQAMKWRHSDPQGVVIMRATLATAPPARAGEAGKTVGELPLTDGAAHCFQQAAITARRRMRQDGTRSLSLTTDHAWVRLTLVFDLEQ